MPASETLECFLNTSAGRMLEYLPPPDDPVLSGPSNANTYIRYVNISGLQNVRMFIALEGTENFRWSEERCIKIRADFYIDGVFLGQRSFYEHFENGRAPRIVFGAVKKYDVAVNGDQFRTVESRAALTFKEVEFAERNPNEAPKATASLGEITIKVFRYKGGYLTQEYDNGQRPRHSRSAPSLAIEQTLTEHDVKGMGIQYLIGTNGYQDVRPSRRNRQQFDERGGLCTKRYDMELVDLPQSPYLCFRFLYRTRAHLEALGLINANPILPYRSLVVGVNKRERSISPSGGSKRIKVESRNKDEKGDEKGDEDDDLVILDEKPVIFRRPRNVPWKPQTSMFKCKVDKGKRPIRNVDQEESSPKPHSSNAPRTEPYTGNTHRTVYIEDEDGLFVTATEAVSTSQVATLTEDNEGNFQFQSPGLPNSGNYQPMAQQGAQTGCLDQAMSILENQLNMGSFGSSNSQKQLQEEEERPQSSGCNEDFIPFEDDYGHTSDIDIEIY